MNSESRITFYSPRNEESRKRSRGRTIFLGALFTAMLLVIYLFTFFPRPFKAPGGPTEPMSGPGAGSRPQEPQQQVIEGKVKERSTFYQSLKENRIPLQWIDLIVSKLRPHVDFKKIKGGTYRFISDIKGELVKFVFETGPAEVYEIVRDSEGGYTAGRKEILLETYLAKIVGEIGSSLFEAMEAIGEGDGLVVAFAEILAWEVDFYKDVREGDRFKVVVEKVYKGDQFIRYGAIHAVEYQRGERTIRGIGYQGEFYNEDGHSLKKAFLKAPLQFTRISSRFSRARRHPILGGVRPHFGVDYAAPIGTPIRAVADGTVLSCGWNGGFGKQVVIRHPNGYTSYYGHLSGFGRGIRKGVRVKQKQIIGYVGSTGLSTGPHLDYRLTRDGRPRNPLKETFPAGLPIRKEEVERFQKRREEMISWLQGETPFHRKVEATTGMLRGL